MSDFHNQFQSITELVQGSAQSLMSKIDHFTFKMLVNGLKSEDYEAATTTIEQLVKDKKPISIPPLYYVYKEHPNMRVREKAEKALALIGDKAEIDKLTEGKDTRDSVTALIQHYGNYKQG